MPEHKPADLSVDLMIEYIARGHGFNKHVLGTDPDPSMTGINGFRKEVDNAGRKIKGGDLKIETPDDFAHYLDQMVDDPSTVGFRDQHGATTLYNTSDNVMAHFTPGGEKLLDFGSVYRYANSDQTYLEYKSDPKIQVLHQFDNTSNPGSVRAGLERMVADLKTNPQNYMKAVNVQNPEYEAKMLATPDRPGRGWGLDEVVRPVNNIKGHSQAYAEANNLGIDPKDYVVMSNHMPEQIDVKSMRREMGKAAPMSAVSVDAVAGFSDKIQAKKWLSELADFSKKGVVTAVAASGLTVLLTQSAIAGQRDLAGLARDLPSDDPRHLSQDQYNDYIALMDELEPRMLSEAADPFLVTSTAQGVANEALSYEKYNEFIAKNHTLDPSLAESLRPGFIKVDTTLEILRDRTLETLQDDAVNLPESMQGLAVSVREVEAANVDLNNVMAKNTPPAFSVLEDTELMALNQPEVQQAMARMDQAMQTMHSEFIATLQSEDGAHFIISQLSDQELLELVERTAKFDDALDAGSGLRAYSVHSAGEKALLERVDCIGSSVEETTECSMFIARKDELKQALLDHPDAMRDYLEDKFMPAANRASSVYDMSAEKIARIEGSEDYIKMAIPLANMRDGIDNFPSQWDELRMTVKNADFYEDNQDMQNARDLAVARFPTELGEVQADIQRELDALTKQREYEAQQREMQRQAFEQMQQQNSVSSHTGTPKQAAVGM